MRSIAMHAVLAATLAAAAAQAQQVNSEDGAPSLKIGGRLHLQHDTFDGVYSDDGARHGTGYLRRARLEASGRLASRLKYAIDVDFEPGGKRILKTAALAWRVPAAGTLWIGRFDPDFGLEQASSSNWTTGIERSAIWDLTGDIADVGKGHGAQYALAGARAYGSVGAYRKQRSDDVVARAAFAPLSDPERTVHLGLSLAAGRLDGDDGRIRTRLAVRGVSEDDIGNRITLARALDSDAVYARRRLAALEFAVAGGPLSVQAERVWSRLSDGASPRVAAGHYLQVAWTLTGERRPYAIDGAKFGRIQPSSAIGAWEVFARHDRLGVRGAPGLLGGGRSRGAAQVLTIGVNWYADEWLRLSLNVLRARTDGIVNDVGDSAGDAVSLRLQARF